jgi:AIPR protein
MSAAAELLDLELRAFVDENRTKLLSILNITERPGGKLSSDDEARLMSGALAAFTIQLYAGVDAETAVNAIIDSGDDQGVDALYVSPPEKKKFAVFLVQSKYSKELTGKGEVALRDMLRFKTGVEGILDAGVTLPVNDDKARIWPKVEHLRGMLKDGLIPKSVTAIVASNGALPNAENQMVIKDGRKQKIVWRFAGAETLTQELIETSAPDGTLRFVGQYMADGKRWLIGTTTARDYAALIEAVGGMDQTLFGSNVRGFLGTSGRPVNAEIQKTLSSEQTADLFVLLNSGVIITCRELDYDENQNESTVVHLDGFQIVNGLQTSSVIFEMLRAGRLPANAKLTVKIIAVGDDDALASQIAYATNLQTPVTPADLRANDHEQKVLERAIDKCGFRYLRKRRERPPAENEVTLTEVTRASLVVWSGRTIVGMSDDDIYIGECYRSAFDNLTAPMAILGALIMRLAAKLNTASDEDNFDVQFGSKDNQDCCIEETAHAIGTALLTEFGPTIGHDRFHAAIAFLTQELGRIDALAEAVRDKSFEILMDRFRGDRAIPQKAQMDALKMVRQQALKALKSKT